ncbi:hypothetical protein [Cupriavidus oxalaticus]|uniref:DUF2399 domain-containing protein n=1 Tax=Cupriavidus oxalaticus TaxID=96344 RepID=A0A5P3VW69_9BURK|nr:hypothetical protein [Cupriavidus oxalaticus]QEZ48949.1 hypothetical protein D2917_32325 [Cupriavidus oxalaticus]
MGRGIHQSTLDLMDAAMVVIQRIKPASVRAVAYQLFISDAIPDMSKASTSKVSRVLTVMRESGAIPWSWIVDEHRRVEQVAQWNDPADFIDNVMVQYRRDYWQDQPNVVMLVSEKGTVRGTLEPVLEHYGVGLLVMHGFGSATVVNGLAEQLAQCDRPLVLLYVGDFDPSGLYMSEADLPERLHRYTQGLDIHHEDNVLPVIERVALTADDVADLPSFSVEDKRTDARYAWYVERYGRRCWELDAMNPVDLRERVTKAIEALMDREAWNHSVAVGEAERRSMLDHAATMKAIFDRDQK